MLNFRTELDSRRDSLVALELQLERTQCPAHAQRVGDKALSLFLELNALELALLRSGPESDARKIARQAGDLRYRADKLEDRADSVQADLINDHLAGKLLPCKCRDCS